ncbi:class I SAM-dependent methyltransferase [Nonomuraea sp. NPDC050022]|uniref:class I SAM-dependent methyltransferase n=1 Tax=Nonomuraea sp. NPDC050022 TaxID=3364358 RepID=UPI00378F102A
MCSDAAWLPFASGSFSCLLCTSALRHFDDPAAALREMVRVLRPGGRTVVADFLGDGPMRRFLFEVRPFTCLTSAGLAVVSAEWKITPFGRYGTVLAAKEEC